MGVDHVITYEANVPLAFNTAVMFIDPYFEKYRQELQDFYDYRNRILSGEVGRRRR